MQLTVYLNTMNYVKNTLLKLLLWSIMIFPVLVFILLYSVILVIDPKCTLLKKV